MDTLCIQSSIFPKNEAFQKVEQIVIASHKSCIKPRKWTSFQCHCRMGRSSEGLCNTFQKILLKKGLFQGSDSRRIFDSGLTKSYENSETGSTQSESQHCGELQSSLDIGHTATENGDVGGNDDNNNSNNGRGGEGGDDGDNSEGSNSDDGFGPILSAEEVFKETKARGVVLPTDMAEVAKVEGLRQLILSRYLDLQGAVWPLGLAIRGCSVLRDRMLADPSFLFKVFTEITIDSCCATFAEIKKRGKDFWAEFELFLADLLVGIAVDIALVGMLAPFIQFGKPPTMSGIRGKMHSVVSALPSSVFEAETPGRRFSLSQRIGTYFYKGLEYGAVGFFCGIIGQGIVNSLMILKRRLKKSDGNEVPVPPLVKSAALWGAFLALSSNTRYQIINGLERVVESSALAKRVPPIALAFTVGVRFANNVYGGMQFVDWARWTGVQ